MRARPPPGGWKLEHVVSPPGVSRPGAAAGIAASTALRGPLETIQSQTPAQGASSRWTFPQNTASPGLAVSTPARGCGPSVLELPRAPEQALSFSLWGQMTGGPPNHSRGSAGTPRWQPYRLSSLFPFAALPEKHMWATGKTQAQL